MREQICANESVGTLYFLRSIRPKPGQGVTPAASPCSGRQLCYTDLDPRVEVNGCVKKVNGQLEGGQMGGNNRDVSTVDISMIQTTSLRTLVLCTGNCLG